MDRISTGHLVWKKSSRSNANTACVEATFDGESVLVRDSKTTTTSGYPTLQADVEDWQSLMKTIVE